MAYTLIFLKQPKRAGTPRRVAMYMSQEYLPHKDRDSNGAVLPDQEWQHPEAHELYYFRVGNLAGDQRGAGLVKDLMEIGSGEMRGHVRIIHLDKCLWLRSRTKNWSLRRGCVHSSFVEEERRSEQERAAKEAAASPDFDYCARCDNRTAQCKNYEHRGSNHCMECNGGVGDRDVQHCLNCLDLPYRLKREAALGHPIVYRGEEPPLEA